MEEKTKCIECRKTIEPKARICVECGSHQDWRRHTKAWTPLLGFFLAFLAFTFSIAPQIKSTFFPSVPKFSVHLSSVSERSMTFIISNLGERRLIVDPLLRCISAERIPEEIVDYEEPFRVQFTTVEGQLDFPTTVAELGGSEVATFTIPDDLTGSWLEREPVFLPPEDERVSEIRSRFSPGLRHTWFGADDSSAVPTYHIVGNEGLISLQPVSEIATFCQLTALDPVVSSEVKEGFGIWQIGNGFWQGSRADQLYDVLGSLIYIRGPGGLNETDPDLCRSAGAPPHCVIPD